MEKHKVLSNRSTILKTLQDMDARLLEDQRELSRKIDEGLSNVYHKLETAESHFNEAVNNLMQQAIFRKDCDNCKKIYIRRDVALALVAGAYFASKIDLSTITKAFGGG